eukprot:5072320-Pyramimonas_sp.AAC.1
MLGSDRRWRQTQIALGSSGVKLETVEETQSIAILSEAQDNGEKRKASPSVGRRKQHQRHVNTKHRS